MPTTTLPSGRHVPGDRGRFGPGRWSGGLAMALLALLAGCASGPREAPLPPSAAAAAAGRDALETERRWLQDWFRGTPVRFTQPEAGRVQVEVPLAFAFERGRTRVLPPLAAVLDKVAESLRRRPVLVLGQLAAAADDGVGHALAQARAAAVQRHLRERGVAASRLALPSTTTTPAVQLRLDLAAP